MVIREPYLFPDVFFSVCAQAEKDTMSPETRRQHLQELKTVAEKLQPTKLSTKHSQISTSGSGSKLDALQAKLSALKKEAKDLGIDSNFTPGRSRTSKHH